MPLRDLLTVAKLKFGAKFVWSEGLDRGKFAGIEVDKYQKDLPMEKAWSEEVLVAYAMNSKPLSKNRGGYVERENSSYRGSRLYCLLQYSSALLWKQVRILQKCLREFQITC